VSLFRQPRRSSEPHADTKAATLYTDRMSVEDPQTIDAMGVNKVSGTLDLLITDQLDWSDLVEHSRVLAAKVNAYVHAVESGQLVRGYPNAAGRSVVIQIVGKYPLTPQAAEYIHQMRSQLVPSGIALTYEQNGASGPN
jgi:hypothetical protein